MSNYIHLYQAKIPAEKRASKLAVLFIVLALIISPFSFGPGFIGATQHDPRPTPITNPDPTNTPRPTPVTPPDPSNTPRPTPTPVTPPDPTPTPTPVTPPDPTPTPTPVTPPDPVNSAPTILTNALKTGSVGQVYADSVIAADVDGDTLVMNFYNLPVGLSKASCRSASIFGIRLTKCAIEGVPQTIGTFNVLVLVYDSFGNYTLKSLELEISN